MNERERGRGRRRWSRGERREEGGGKGERRKKTGGGSQEGGEERELRMNEESREGVEVG